MVGFVLHCGIKGTSGDTKRKEKNKIRFGFVCKAGLGGSGCCGSCRASLQRRIWVLLPPLLNTNIFGGDAEPLRGFQQCPHGSALPNPTPKKNRERRRVAGSSSTPGRGIPMI